MRTDSISLIIFVGSVLLSLFERGDYQQSRLCSASPITNPLREDGSNLHDIIPEYFDSKTKDKRYYNLEPRSNVTVQHEVRHKLTLNSKKDSKFHLRWSTSVGSPIYATPVIFPNKKTGKKQIFINTYYQYAELLNADGSKSWGWPLTFEDSSFQSSPIIYDIDGDGNTDMGIADKNGNMFWVRIGEYGEYLEDYHIQVPKLKVKRDWASTLDPQFTDSMVMMSMFDREPPAQAEAKRSKAKPDDLKSLLASFPTGDGVNELKAPPTEQKRRLQETNNDQSATGGDAESKEEGSMALGELPQNDQGEHIDREDIVPDFGEEGMPGIGDDFASESAARERMGHYYEYQPPDPMDQQQQQQAPEELGSSGDQMESPPDGPVDSLSSSSAPGEEEEGEESLLGPDGTPLEPPPDGTYEYGYRRAPGRAHRFDYGYGHHMYGGMYNESDFVMVDAHILTSPVLADINGDGNMEILFSVSYYFDKAEYVGKELDFDPDLFVAGGVACWDLNDQYWTWMVHLDLTTTKSKFQAMIYAPPTVADLDGDGRSEVIVGTALGLLYVLDGDSGFVRRYFPMQFHSIQAAVAVGDLLGDRGLEMVVVDMGGTVAAVSLDGDILWDVHLSGTLPFPATLGDVDGDGCIDVIVVATTVSKGSHIYALRGDTGSTLKGYPISLPGNADVTSPVVLVDLHLRSARERFAVRGNLTEELAEKKRARTRRRSSGGSLVPLPLIIDDPFPLGLVRDSQPAAAAAVDNESSSIDQPIIDIRQHGLHLILTSFDGGIYIIDGKGEVDGGSGGLGLLGQLLRPPFETQKIDIGEHIYSVPLVDDITGDGYLDLLVGTLNGQLALYESSIPFHPINAWTSFPNHRLNGFTHAEMGVSIPVEEKEKLRQHDIKGTNMLSISFEIWDTTYWKPSMAKAIQEGQISYKVAVTRGTNRLDPLWSRNFNKPGRYIAEVPISPPELGLLVVSMVSEHGRYFEDAVHVSISTRFYVWIKYMIALPVVVLTFTLLARLKP